MRKTQNPRRRHKRNAARKRYQTARNRAKHNDPRTPDERQLSALEWLVRVVVRRNLG